LDRSSSEATSAAGQTLFDKVWDRHTIVQRSGLLDVRRHERRPRVARLALPDGPEAWFEIDPFRKERLLHGLDEIELTLRHEAAISAFERRHAAAQPEVKASAAEKAHR
jgi:hypothetical protein